jgi:hypothetical protein
MPKIKVKRSTPWNDAATPGPESDSPCGGLGSGGVA